MKIFLHISFLFNRSLPSFNCGNPVDETVKHDNKNNNKINGQKVEKFFYSEKKTQNKTNLYPLMLCLGRSV